MNDRDYPQNFNMDSREKLEDLAGKLFLKHLTKKEVSGKMKLNAQAGLVCIALIALQKRWLHWSLT
jgi:hypothetical protein